MNTHDHSRHWHYLASRDWKTARGLFEIKRYDACLFFCHLTLEKILKALVVEHTGKDAPFIHDLERLAAIAETSLTPEKINQLRSISAFNIAGRYSDYKFAFYKKCTLSYTRQYLLITKELISCLRKEYLKN